MATTYSFQDISCVISHPAIGQHIVTGSGAKTLALSMSGDISAHDIAADGSVMISKIPVPNGTITITAQQTSPLHDFMTKWYNYIKSADSSAFATGSITIRSPQMKVLHQCSGVSIQKKADKTYEATGGNVAWACMAAKIEDSVI